MSPQEHHWPGASGWREFFDLLSDAVIVLDARARIVLANTAALRVLPCEVRLTVEQFNATLGPSMVRWLRHAAMAQRDPGPPPAAKLPDGRALHVISRRLDAQHVAMHIAPEVAEPPATAAMQRSAALTLSQAGMRETIALLWESPFPALLQDDDFRILDVNQPFLDLIGRTREETIGHDPLDWRPPEDRAATLAARERLHASRTQPAEPALVDSRLIDSSGRERRYRAARRTLVDENGMHLYLAVLQDTTGEHLAREGAERSLRELEEWFDLSPVGMVLSDQRGLLVRTNPAFDALAGTRPVSLADAPAGLRDLLGWSANAVEPSTITEKTSPAQRQCWVALPGQEPRLLRATLRSYRTPGAALRTMAVIEDVTQLKPSE